MWYQPTGGKINKMLKEKKKNKLIDIDNKTVVTRGEKKCRKVQVSKGGQIYGNGRTAGSEHKIKYTDIK